MGFLTDAAILGAGATAITDLWGFARKPLLGVAPPDYGMVGRWVAHMAHGKFRHRSIMAAAAIRGERPLGWLVHYLIGMMFAATLLAVRGVAWLEEPTLVPALLTGIGTVAAPFLLLQPAMGLGLAASRTPRPASARLQSFLMHVVFGLGLYATGWTMHMLSSSW